MRQLTWVCFVVMGVVLLNICIDIWQAPGARQYYRQRMQLFRARRQYHRRERALRSWMDTKEARVDPTEWPRWRNMDRSQQREVHGLRH